MNKFHFINLSGPSSLATIFCNTNKKSKSIILGGESTFTCNVYNLLEESKIDKWTHTGLM